MRQRKATHSVEVLVLRHFGDSIPNGLLEALQVKVHELLLAEDIRARQPRVVKTISIGKLVFARSLSDPRDCVMRG